jgi:uncharacterized protein (DUF1800 family)
MGGANSILSAMEARQLLQRTGFGAKPADVAKLVGVTRGVAVDKMLNFKARPFKPSGRYIENIHDSWLKQMVRTTHPVQEKLVLFWHDHFATSFDKVGSVRWMARQNKILRVHSKGNFKTLLNAINVDPAMMEFLDTQRNRRAEPNENYPRELMELFTLGVFDFNGQPNYLQSDVVQVARAFSGWRYDDGTGKPYFNEGQHDFLSDYPARGAKVIFKVRGGFGAGGHSFVPAAGEGADEIAAVVDILLTHRDSDGKVTAARRIARRLLEFFCHDGFAVPTQAVRDVVDPIVAASAFDSLWELRPLLREIFVHDAFYQYAANPVSVKWPIDYVVSTFRLLKMLPRGLYAYVDGGSYRGVRDMLADMGQVILQPPSVFGWDWETAWLNSATLLARYDFARNIAGARGRLPYHLKAEELVSPVLTDPAQILDAVAAVLGLKDRLSAADRTALLAYLTDDGAVSSLDLTDYDIRNRKLHGLFGLLLQSPIYQLH